MTPVVSSSAWLVEVVAAFAFTMGAAYWLLDTGGRDLRDD
jgi:hypothetical protein